jgi:two-component system, OmpR family, alkaline phosphatase synthesis response regulator PhoP
MKTVLVVDDQPNVRLLIREYLTQEGFRVVEAENGRQALLVARQEHPDLLLLDIMMPEMGGYEFVRAYRKEAATPIILLTAKQEESDKVLGLELGADDYVTKPFGMRELVARIHAVLRRVEGDPTGEPDVLRAADVVLDRGSHAVTVAAAPVSLTPSEFELLSLLMSAPGRVFSRAQLLEHLQGDEAESVERTIDVHIRNLRAKIEPNPATPQYIETVFGVGYRFRSGDRGN